MNDETTPGQDAPAVQSIEAVTGLPADGLQMDPSPSAADTAQAEQPNTSEPAPATPEQGAILHLGAATGPVFNDGDLPRAQALPELGDDFEGEVTRPIFEAPGFEFFRDTDGTTKRIVAVGNDFFKVLHTRE